MKKQFLSFVKQLNKQFKADLLVQERVRKNGYDVTAAMLPSVVISSLVDFALSHGYHYYISSASTGLVAFSIYNND